MTDTEPTIDASADEPSDAAARESDHALYLRFLAKQAAVQAAKRHERRAADDRAHRETEARLAAILGAAANNGRGGCRWCGITLGITVDGAYTHPPVRECPGPTPDPCDMCGRAWSWSRASMSWQHSCAGKQVARPSSQSVERVKSADTPTSGGGFFGYRKGED